MNQEFLGWLLNVVLFSAAGWLIARERQRPAGAKIIVGLLVAAACGYFIGRSTTVIGVDEFRLNLNWMIVAFCLSHALGLVVRTRRLAASPAA